MVSRGYGYFLFYIYMLKSFIDFQNTFHEDCIRLKPLCVGAKKNYWVPGQGCMSNDLFILCFDLLNIKLFKLICIVILIFQDQIQTKKKNKRPFASKFFMPEQSLLDLAHLGRFHTIGCYFCLYAEIQDPSNIMML